MILVYYYLIISLFSVIIYFYLLTLLELFL